MSPAIDRNLNLPEPDWIKTFKLQCFVTCSAVPGVAESDLTATGYSQCFSILHTYIGVVALPRRNFHLNFQLL